MTHFIIGIAGGSGCGKSTLAYGLKDEYPDLIEVVHFDDYQKEEVDVPFFENMRNWDHPNSINFKQLCQDLIQLINNESVEVMTKSTILNSDYEEKGRTKHILRPKKIIIVEGYMAFYDRKIQELFDLKIFLDCPIIESMKRRNKIICGEDNEYNIKTLIPMHTKYVIPTKDMANLLIDVVKNNKDEVFNIVCKKLSELKVLSV
ncbi:MAG: deoxynucleoside kinase [Candidatus Pacebacteria bacterium]|nr:deoxynucleoside kinase [Candidatus Paceibacterota bacterium]